MTVLAPKQEQLCEQLSWDLTVLATVVIWCERFSAFGAAAPVPEGRGQG